MTQRLMAFFFYFFCALGVFHILFVLTAKRLDDSAVEPKNEGRQALRYIWEEVK